MSTNAGNLLLKNLISEANAATNTTSTAQTRANTCLYPNLNLYLPEGSQKKILVWPLAGSPWVTIGQSLDTKTRLLPLQVSSPSQYAFKFNSEQ